MCLGVFFPKYKQQEHSWCLRKPWIVQPLRIKPTVACFSISQGRSLQNGSNRTAMARVGAANRNWRCDDWNVFSLNWEICFPVRVANNLYLYQCPCYKSWQLRLRSILRTFAFRRVLTCLNTTVRPHQHQPHHTRQYIFYCIQTQNHFFETFIRPHFSLLYFYLFFVVENCSL